MKEFWKKKNVLITGINGFVGSNLAKKLINYNANVVGLIRNLNYKSLLFFEQINQKCLIVNGDLNNKDIIKRIIIENKIDIVFHLGAQVEVGLALKDPYETFETNIRGTYSLLNVINDYQHSIKSIIIASSDKAYGEYPKEKMPYRETYPLLPKFPYDTSKACADMICNAYSIDQYGLPIVITRFSNIYGPGQMNFSAIVPDGIRSALGYSTFIPRSDGSMVRDFIFSEDVVDLYMRIGKELSLNPHKLRGEIFNAGSNDPIDMKSLLKKIYNFVDNYEDLKIILNHMKGKKTKGEIQHQHMSFDKVFDFFNWKPTHSIDEGIQKSINWYNKNLNKI